MCQTTFIYNINFPYRTTEGVGIYRGREGKGGGGSEAQFLKIEKFRGSNWNFCGNGIPTKMVSVMEVWMFSGIDTIISLYSWSLRPRVEVAWVWDTYNNDAGKIGKNLGIWPWHFLVVAAIWLVVFDFLNQKYSVSVESQYVFWGIEKFDPYSRFGFFFTYSMT